MRGAERPGKVHWTRPFLLPLRPVEQDAAWKIFIDIADDGHDTEKVEKLLLLTDNLPLAISLLAHSVNSEGGCSNVLSRWDQETTSLISQGHNRRDNLDLSISLSFSSPRIRSDSQELLSLLSILPDGLSGVDLVQSALPISNILRCKAALLGTTLAYIDEQKRLKALIPIREYMKRTHPSGDHIIGPLLRYFQELLELYIDNLERSPGLLSHAVPRISVNYSNIQNVLWYGLQQGHPDLENSIYCTLYLNSFCRIMVRGRLTLMERIRSLLPQPPNHRFETYFITELFISFREHRIHNPQTLVTQALEHFKYFDDTDLQCVFYENVAFYHMDHNHISTSIKFSQSGLSLAISTGNTKRQCNALYRLAWCQWYLGDYSAAQQYAYSGRRLARISADLYREALTLDEEAMSLTMLENYQQSMPLSSRARGLLALCSMSGSQLDLSLMNSQAEAHRFKSEYIDAHNIHIEILQAAPLDKDPYRHAMTLLNIAQVDVALGAPKSNVQRNNDRAKEIFIVKGDLRLMLTCDVVQADLHLRERDIQAARALFEKILRSSWGKYTDVVSGCLERLGDVSCWSMMGSMCSWPTVLLAHSLKFKDKLGISKALQFLGDVVLSQGGSEENTAISLFTVAIEQFSYMDVHHSRGECLLRLGDIAKRHGELDKAVELWQGARLLFERASQVKQIEKIEVRLASVR
ncbi:hypothetical protein K438DRAFT_845535 [Mycena galopus ATCC 62051]|nr:hypothetical protein K438DRAFT_845535 [Mycena galopus ATCC 62051]